MKAKILTPREKWQATWPAVAARTAKADALQIGHRLMTDLPGIDWDVASGRLPRKWCVIVPPVFEQSALRALRSAGMPRFL